MKGILAGAITIEQLLAAQRNAPKDNALIVTAEGAGREMYAFNKADFKNENWIVELQKVENWKKTDQIFSVENPRFTGWWYIEESILAEGL